MLKYFVLFFVMNSKNDDLSKRLPKILSCSAKYNFELTRVLDNIIFLD